MTKAANTAARIRTPCPLQRILEHLRGALEAGGDRCAGRFEFALDAR